MQNEDFIENKIANSGLITLSLEDYYPKGERKHLDIAPWLYEGIMLREKDFRASVQNHDWGQYQDCYVWVGCSEDAIIPQWAYMLLSSSLAAFAKKVVYGNREQLETVLMDEAIQQADLSELTDQRVIIKGCGDLPIPPHAYVSLVSRLQPIVKSIMYGEACSTVPIYKKK
ncbi:DUF2480 family protein [Owenweeksia hongkongensis]|uniref:DUF2480 family protein n=1 Tax=Owenweeksia hongkongensis TaxID=253245 RepID=UPI003A9424A4